MKTFILVALFLLSVSILSHVHGQTDTIPAITCTTLSSDSLQVDTILIQLQASVDTCRNQVERLQAMSDMPVKKFYAAARNLALARSNLMIYIAQTNPDRAMIAMATAKLYQRRAVAFNDKATDR